MLLSYILTSSLFHVGGAMFLKFAKLSGRLGFTSTGENILLKARRLESCIEIIQLFVDGSIGALRYQICCC